MGGPNLYFRRRVIRDTYNRARAEQQTESLVLSDESDCTYLYFYLRNTLRNQPGECVCTDLYSTYNADQLIMSSNESRVQINPPASSRWLLGWMNYVAKWMGPGDVDNGSTSHMEGEFEEDMTPEDWSEWEWIMSPSEEFLQKHNQWQMEKTESELNTLRGTSSQVCISFHVHYAI